MRKHFYAADNCYGLKVAYDSEGWTVHTFTNKNDRDLYVKNHENTESVSYKTACKISPDLAGNAESWLNAWRVVHH